MPYFSPQYQSYFFWQTNMKFKAAPSLTFYSNVLQSWCFVLDHFSEQIQISESKKAHILVKCQHFFFFFVGRCPMHQRIVSHLCVVQARPPYGQLTLQTAAENQCHLHHEKASFKKTFSFKYQFLNTKSHMQLITKMVWANFASRKQTCLKFTKELCVFMYYYQHWTKHPKNRSKLS